MWRQNKSRKAGTKGKGMRAVLWGMAGGAGVPASSTRTSLGSMPRDGHAEHSEGAQGRGRAQLG